MDTPWTCTGINFQMRQVLRGGVSWKTSTWNAGRLYIMNFCDRCLTFVPFVLQPAPSRSHTMFVVPQHTLACGERGIMAMLETPRLTGHIQARSVPRPGRSLASKPRGREQC